LWDGVDTLSQVSDNWWSLNPSSGVGSGYDVKMSYSSGATEGQNRQNFGPSDGVWTNMASVVGFGWARTSTGLSEFTIVFEIRDTTTLTVLDSGQVIVTLEVGS
jgi:hypothetical protein